MIPKKYLEIIRCPVSKQSLRLFNNKLISQNKKYKYVITNEKIPVFFKDEIDSDTSIQKDHYNKIYKKFLENLSYPHTIEYCDYLDKKLVQILDNKKYQFFAEICCGAAEGLKLFNKNYKNGIGVDISIKMLNNAYYSNNKLNYQLLQGDAINLPLKDNVLDCVLILGGIHHINQRNLLYKEINRILKPNGVFIWREPVDDFFLWRYIRKVIYKFSPMLDEKTEKPLRYKETKKQLVDNGFKLEKWNTFGFFGFCLFMNSDVLFVNRFFRFIPKIRSIVKFFIKIDHFITNLSLFRNRGLIVIGYAKKVFIKK